MKQVSTLELSANETAEIQASIIQYMTEIERLQDQMQRDQVEIDRSRTRTYALLADLKSTLSSADQKAS